MNKYITLAIAVLFNLTGCSNDYQMESNLNKENFTEYFKASGVKVLTNQELSRYPYKVLGTVEGSRCQEDANQPQPEKIEAQTHARQLAADMGANAIVFSTCIEFEQSSACLSSLSCYGKAVQLLQDEPFE